jgi:hypothetical protein
LESKVHIDKIGRLKMAVAHVVRTGLKKISPTGQVVDSKEPISAHLNFSTEDRVLMNPNVPNTYTFGSDEESDEKIPAYPTIEEYIVAEAAEGFILRHMSQNIIVTST